MAGMRPIKGLYLLGFVPILQSSACRVKPFLFQIDSLPRCHAYSTFSTPPSYTYRIAASYSAKGRRFNPRTDFFSFDPLKQPEPAELIARQRPNSGQDAFFVSNIGRSTNVAFGVADGVGGWSDMGIDSAHFSHGLCESMSHIARAMNLKDEAWTNTSSLLWRGYDRVIEDKTIEGGGTTACLAIGSNDGSLEVAKYDNYREHKEI